MNSQRRSPYASVREVAERFKVSETSIYRSRGVFASLRFVQVNGRRLVMRADVEALDRELESRARSAADGLRLVKRRAQG